jgi:hypothetical protein
MGSGDADVTFVWVDMLCRQHISRTQFNAIQPIQHARQPNVMHMHRQLKLELERGCVNLACICQPQQPNHHVRRLTTRTPHVSRPVSDRHMLVVCASCVS